jgi:hypothetical protein
VLDFNKIRNKELTLAELCQDLSVDDLRRLTDEMIDAQLNLIAVATDADVVFTPEDPDAQDRYAESEAEVNLPWSLGHVIVHVTASSEESAAQAANLARGVKIEGRMRYEVPWEMVTRMDQLRQRLEESRRIRQAFLNTWPDVPHLENTYTPNYPKARPRNPIMQFVGGLAHDDAHLGQIAEILRQARAVHP